MIVRDNHGSGGEDGDVSEEAAVIICSSHLY
jgi:hypothetical protein